MRVLIACQCLLVYFPLLFSLPEATSVYQKDSYVLPESDLRGAQPVVCHANNRVELSRRHILADGDGIEVNGNCDVVISHSHVVAGGTGVIVNGNGNVKIENSFIQGAEGGLVAHATSRAEYRNSTLRGGTSKFALAKIVDEGGNSLEDIPVPHSSHLEPSEPISCNGRQRITVINRYIETDGDGLVVEGSCQVLLSDSHIVAGGHAVRISDSGSVRIRNSTLEGKEGALLAADDAKAHAAGSNIRGRVTGRLLDGGGNAMK
jgi:hypothetical protein